MFARFFLLLQTNYLNLLQMSEQPDDVWVFLSLMAVHSDSAQRFALLAEIRYAHTAHAWPPAPSTQRLTTVGAARVALQEPRHGLAEANRAKRTAAPARRGPARGHGNRCEPAAGVHPRVKRVYSNTRQGRIRSPSPTSSLAAAMKGRRSSCEMLLSLLRVTTSGYNFYFALL